MKKVKNRIKFSDILLYTVLALSVVHIIVLMLALFNVFTADFLKENNFNYIVAFVLVAICLALYICFLAIEHKNKLVFPEWFKIVFFIGFFVFTNVYYFFGLFSHLASLIIFNLALAFVINIIALSVFYNTQKTNNVLKATPTFTALSTFCYSVSFGAILETIICAFKLIVAKNSVFSTMSMVIIDMCILLFVSAVMALVYGISLSKQKVAINSCLIKYYND